MKVVTEAMMLKALDDETWSQRKTMLLTQLIIEVEGMKRDISSVEFERKMLIEKVEEEVLSGISRQEAEYKYSGQMRGINNLHSEKAVYNQALQDVLSLLKKHKDE